MINKKEFLKLNFTLFNDIIKNLKTSYNINIKENSNNA